jgi:hypothetical protein
MDGFEVTKAPVGILTASGRICHTSSSFRSDEEARANGCLIAAAPDLYAALEEIINTPWIGGKGGFVRARAALAKARGEQ